MNILQSFALDCWQQTSIRHREIHSSQKSVGYELRFIVIISNYFWPDQNVLYQNIRLPTRKQVQMEPQQPKLASFFDNHQLPYTFYFDISAEPPLKVHLTLEPRLILQEAMVEAIGKANQQLAKTGLSLRNEISLYKPRLAGKNFKPKTDMPALSLYQKICDLKVSDIAVQIVNKEKAIITQKVPNQVKQNPQKTPQLPQQGQKESQEQKKEVIKELQSLTIDEKEKLPQK